MLSDMEKAAFSNHYTRYGRYFVHVFVESGTACNESWGAVQSCKRPKLILNKLKSREISSSYNLFIRYPFVLIFQTEHSNDTVVLRANFKTIEQR